jgi:integrase/recombinase XerD
MINLATVAYNSHKVIKSTNDMEIPRCIALFESATKSRVTFKAYLYNVKRFMKYCNISEFDDLLKLDSKFLNQKIEDWLIYLRSKVSPNSIPTMYYGLELFFAMNDMVTNTIKLRRMLPAKVKKSGANPWKTTDIRKMLLVTRHTRDKALVHFLASTGARIGCIEGLKIRNIVDMPLECKAVLIYDDDKEEYWAFLTPEASKAVQDYFAEREQDGEIINLESPVFRTVYGRKNKKNPKSLGIQSARCSIYRLIEQARIVREKQGFCFDIQMDMGFRKRFNTILKVNSEVNSNIAEKLMGHKRGLDGSYFVPTKEQCFEEFKKSIPELLIDESLRLKEELNKTCQKLDKEFSKKDIRMQELEDRAKRTEMLLVQLMKRLES